MSEREKAMVFPRLDGGPTRTARIPRDADTVKSEPSNEQRPYESVRLHIGRRKAARC